MVERVTRRNGDEEDEGASEMRQGPRSGDTVVVACKLPNGLFLQLYEMIDSQESSPAGNRTIKKSQPVGDRVRINGSAVPREKLEQGIDYAIPAGYALTVISREFWERWVKQNRDSDLLVNKVLFAADSQDKAAGRAREQTKAGIKSGWEPLDPKKPPRVGNVNIQKYGTEQTNQ